MTDLLHFPGFPALSTILRLSDGTSHAADQWLRVEDLLYLIVVVSFVSWHVLFHISAKEQVGGTFLTHFLSVFPDVVLLCLLYVYEFCARPIVKDWFRELFNSEALPQPTHILLDVVPVGCLSASFAALIILYLWAAQSRKSPNLISGIRWALLIYGLFLLAIPIALMMPLI